MTDALKELMRDCTVLLRDAQGRAIGSGFFVVPGVVLTAAHVVRSTAAVVTGTTWQGTDLGTLTIEQMFPDEKGGAQQWALPDLALLRADEGKAAGHPCVRLSAVKPGPRLFAAGYARGVVDGHPINGVNFRFETVRPEADCGIICCSHGELNDGMSGGPLLDLSSGTVIGVVKAQRAGQLPIGGVAVAVSALESRDSELWAANSRFHQADRRWEFARMNRSAVSDPAEATRIQLELVRDAVNERPMILPPGRVIDDIVQVPSVRSAAMDDTDAARLNVSNPDVLSFDSGKQPGGVFQWMPLRTRQWRKIVLHGLPGLGKSCLLNIHAKAVAADSLTRLEQNPLEALSLHIPVVVDCAAYGRALPDVVKSADQALGALIRVLCASAGVEAENSPVQAVIRSAHADGRLVACLDGLDEIAVGDEDKINRSLQLLADRDNQLLITSRPDRRLAKVVASLGVRSAKQASRQDFFTGEVTGFSLGQTYGFVRAWFADRESAREKIELALQERGELRELTRVPLLAAFLCRLNAQAVDGGAVLPGSPAELYDAVIKGALGGTWLEGSRQAIDPDSPPDVALRFAVLSGAIARLSARWREGVDRFSRAELAEALSAQPGFDRAVAGAVTRWNIRTARNRAAGVVAPHGANALLWEYRYDGLLVADVDGTGTPLIRFAHPILAEYCIAAHLAEAPDAELAEAIAEHRWFDSFWHEIWPLVAAKMERPDRLVAPLLDPTIDAWHEQLMLAARCIARVPDKISDNRISTTVRSLAELVHAERPFDAERALDALCELIRAQVEPAVSAARDLIRTTPTRARLRLVAQLAEIGDFEALDQARKIVSDHSLPAGYRAWCIRSLVMAEDADGIKVLRDAVKSAQQYGELRRLAAAIPVETALGSDAAFEVLRDQQVPVAIRAAMGTAIVRSGIPHLLAPVTELARTPITRWSLRTVLVAEMLAVGQDEVIGVGLTLAENPNVVADDKIILVENLIRRGQASVLEGAGELVTRLDVVLSRRVRLAQAMAELGDIGISALEREVESDKYPAQKLGPLIALIEVGRALDIAHQIVTDSGAPPWIRTRLAAAVLQSGDDQTSPDIAAEIVGIQDNNGYQNELIVAMAKRSMPGTWETTHAYLLAAAQNAGNAYLGKRELMDGLAQPGGAGIGILGKIAHDADLAEQDRGLAVIALADAAPEEASQVAAAIMTALSEFVRSRVLLALAAKGVAGVIGEVADLLNTEGDEAYRAIYQLLSSAHTSRELVARSLEYGRRAAIPPQAATRKLISLNEDFLREVGVNPTSDAERRSMLDWVYTRLETAAGSKMVAFLDRTALDEFESLDNQVERTDFLNARVSGYRVLVREQFELLRQRIKDDPTIVPHFRPESHSAIDLIAHTANVLSEWIRTTSPSTARTSANFLLRNKGTLVTELSVDLLQQAQRLNDASRFNAYRGHEYLVRRALADGVTSATNLMTDVDRFYDAMRRYFADGNGEELLNSSLAALLFVHGAGEVAYFYGGLGAAILEKDELAAGMLVISHRTVSPRQKAHGLGTIDDAVTQFDWSEEKRRRLRAALADGLDA